MRHKWRKIHRAHIRQTARWTEFDCNVWLNDELSLSRFGECILTICKLIRNAIWAFIFSVNGFFSWFSCCAAYLAIERQTERCGVFKQAISDIYHRYETNNHAPSNHTTMPYMNIEVKLSLKFTRIFSSKRRKYFRIRFRGSRREL